MKRVAAYFAVLACCSFAGAAPQRAAPSWQAALPGYSFRFPQDYGAHERFQNEWWYYTGDLAAKNGDRYGFELTFFRLGIQPGIARASAWDVNDLYLAHLAISDIHGQKFSYSERTGRAALQQAGAASGDEHAWIGSWRARRLANGLHLLDASDGGVSVHLTAAPAKPAAIHGSDGVSRKGGCASCASHYYSFTRLRTTGTITVDGATRTVSGFAWNDHEWGSDEVEPGVAGWSWFSMQLDNGTDIMLYLLRRNDGQIVAQSSGTIDDAAGRTQHLSLREISVEPKAWWTSPHDGARYPARWRVNIGSHHLALDVEPLLADQELLTRRSTRIAYWEGACAVRGTYEGKQVGGFGYTELTGYASHL